MIRFERAFLRLLKAGRFVDHCRFPRTGSAVGGIVTRWRHVTFAIRACSVSTTPLQLEHPLQPQELPPEMILPSRGNLPPVSNLFVHGVSLNLGVAIEIPVDAKRANL